MQTSDAFTMIELMVVLAIMTLLSAIAIPNYFGYLAKAKQAEVAINLSALHAAQVSHWAETGSYTTRLAGPDGAGWTPAGYKGQGSNSCYYSYGFFGGDAQEGITCFSGTLKTPQSTGVQTRADAHHFVAAAIADLGDGKLDIWTVDENRSIVHVRDGLHES